MAAMSGLSIKDFILEKTLSSEEPYSQEELEAFRKLEECLRHELNRLGGESFLKFLWKR